MASTRRAITLWLPNEVDLQARSFRRDSPPRERLVAANAALAATLCRGLVERQGPESHASFWEAGRLKIPQRRPDRGTLLPRNADRPACSRVPGERIVQVRQATNWSMSKPLDRPCGSSGHHTSQHRFRRTHWKRADTCRCARHASAVNPVFNPLQGVHHLLEADAGIQEGDGHRASQSAVCSH